MGFNQYNEPPAHIVIVNFSDLKHKINNKWPNVHINTHTQRQTYAWYTMLQENEL